MLHMHMLLPTEPWSTESVRPRLTHSSSPLPHMLDTLDTPLLLPTLVQTPTREEWTRPPGTAATAWGAATAYPAYPTYGAAAMSCGSASASRFP